MTLREARQLVSEGLGMTLQHRDGEYRVNFKGGLEATAYYTNDLEDAFHTAEAMARSAKALQPKYKPTKEQVAKYKRDERARHKAAGLCQNCHEPVHNGKSFCLRHLLKHRILTRQGAK